MSQDRPDSVGPMPEPSQHDDGQPEASAVDATLNRRRMLIGVVVSAVVLSCAGLGASVWVKSPQQVAAEAAPPKASVISAPVEKRVLKQTVVLRGSVAPGKEIGVSVPAPAEGKSVVTRSVVRKSQRIRAGQVVAEVSGRPMIAMYGRIPIYRDMRPGAKGPDVLQLQAALRNLGYSVGDRPGVFGSSTQAAAKRLYGDRGYDPPTATGPSASPGSGSGSDDSAGGPSTGDASSSGARSIFVKAGEVFFVPKFPARVTSVKAALGREVKGTLLTLAEGDLVVRGSLSPPDRKLVDVGDQVRIFSEELELEVRGRVGSIGALDGGPPEGGEGEAGSGEGQEPASEPGHPILVTGVKQLPEKLAAQDVRLTIEAASTSGAVLAVPSSAVYASADGSTQVIELLPGGKQRRVTVRIGATAGGFVEVESAELAQNDLVVVGE
ncbi:peptidoglycan-binding protein [Actinomadura alba]|uniref:Peptidoglycan binding-like domain-containing protein n=1 Tax=Actinomadura alba TaxID=406431 RepID=A0ABR7LVW4_9ACTN|nr:peptidoglycan-binding protein [Actinomadura alba]MBC6468813.1 hypothetical protein [Actinomadura alba]